MDREGQRRTTKKLTKKNTEKGTKNFTREATNKVKNKVTNRVAGRGLSSLNNRAGNKSVDPRSAVGKAAVNQRINSVARQIIDEIGDGLDDAIHQVKNQVTKDSVRYVEVILGYEDQRIDNFLIRELKGVPLSHIYRVIRKGEVRVNKKRIKQTHKLQLGDIVRIPPMSTGPKSVPPDPERFQYLKDRIVYEDDTIFILNKPHGLAVHEGSNIQSGLIEALRVVFPEHKQLELVHRLDKETSGLIIIAKNRSVMKLLNEMLRERQIKKTYQAVVVGRWPKGLNKVDLPLEGDKESVTTFQILENREKTTLIEAHPLTGRTHQIRLHCQASGHSIVGDSLYGDKNFELYNDSPRMYLHAVQLKFIHPKTGEMIQVKAESGF